MQMTFLKKYIILRGASPMIYYNISSAIIQWMCFFFPSLSLRWWILVLFLSRQYRKRGGCGWGDKPSLSARLSSPSWLELEGTGGVDAGVQCWAVELSVAVANFDNASVFVQKLNATREGAIRVRSHPRFPLVWTEWCWRHISGQTNWKCKPEDFCFCKLPFIFVCIVS